MHVLMTADTVGGVWTYSLELIRALEGDAHVSLLTMGAAPTTAQRKALRALPNVDLHESEYRLEWMDDPWADVERATEWALDIAHRVDPDLIHLNNYGQGHADWPAPVILVAHSCVYSWWEAVYGRPNPEPQERWASYRDRVVRAVERADCVVAPTRAMLDSFGRHYGCAARTNVIFNARRESEFEPGKKRPYVFAAGRLWDPAKNLKALDAAAAGVDWPVYVAGPTQPPCSAADDNGSPNHVAPLGPLAPELVCGWLSEASIYALPAFYEPFGLSILEAALCGCALVIGDIPSLRELWHDAAVFVPPDDPHAIRDAIQGLVESEHDRSALAHAARERAQRYRPESMRAAYLELYEKLAPCGKESVACVS